MIEFLVCCLVLYFFWRQLLAVALFAAVVAVPLLVGVLVYANTLSTGGALVAAIGAVVVFCAYLGEAADRFGK